MARRERRGVELDVGRAGGVTVSRQDEIVLQFDYGQIAEGRRAFVQEMAAGVKGRLGNMARGALEVGAMLNAIRADFPHGTWQPFLMQEYGFSSPRQPQRWMQAAARLGPRLDEFVGLPDTVLGLLAGATDEVIDRVSELAARGEAVGVADVRLLMTAYDSGLGDQIERNSGLGQRASGLADRDAQKDGWEEAESTPRQGGQGERHTVRANVTVQTESAGWAEIGEDEGKVVELVAGAAVMRGETRACGEEPAGAAELPGSGQLVIYGAALEADWEALGWKFVHTEAGWHGLDLRGEVATDTYGTRGGVIHALQVGAFSRAFFEAQQGGGSRAHGEREEADRRYVLTLPEWVMVKLQVAAETGGLDAVLTRPGVQVLLAALAEVGK